MGRRKADANDEELRQVLEQLLQEDADISARSAVRRHSKLANASAIVRSPQRAMLVEEYRARQVHARSLVRRLNKLSGAEAARMIEQKDEEIARMKIQLAALIESHRLMIVAVGEVGGTRKLAELYQRHRETREALLTLGETLDLRQ